MQYEVELNTSVAGRTQEKFKRKHKVKNLLEKVLGFNEIPEFHCNQAKLFIFNGDQKRHRNNTTA